MTTTEQDISADEIRRRLRALDDYYWSLMRGMGDGSWDEGERTDRELAKVRATKSKLEAALKAHGTAGK